MLDDLGNKIEMDQSFKEIFRNKKVIFDLRIIFKVIIIDENIINVKISNSNSINELK